MTQPDIAASAQPEVASAAPPANSQRASANTGEMRSTTFMLPETVEATIRPFEFHASNEDHADLKRRISTNRWPDRETAEDDTQGVQLAAMEKLAAYWASDYGWRDAKR